MKASELRKKSDAELNQELLELGRELFNLRMQRGSDQLSNSSAFSVAKKSVARVKTIQAERRKGNLT